MALVINEKKLAANKTLQKLNKEHSQLEEGQEQIVKRASKIINRIQDKCPHEHVEKSGGEMWSAWPDWGYYNTWYKCLDCGKKWKNYDAPLSVVENV